MVGPKPEQLAHSEQLVPTRVGLVVHPTRDVRDPMSELRSWAELRGSQLVQVDASCQQQRVAQQGQAERCDLLVSIGGDGTALAAIRAGAEVRRPVLAVACGSLGILTAVPAMHIVEALERFSQGEWTPRSLPALEVTHAGQMLLALNDIALVRAGSGQVRVSIEVDGELFARLAGDGCVASTPAGSSAYALAADGPLLAPELEAILITPLPTHGGSQPPLVVRANSVIGLSPLPGHGVARLEHDGQIAGSLDGPLTIRFRAAVATVVSFTDQASFLTVLRERGVITDSPRILVEDARS